MPYSTFGDVQQLLQQTFTGNSTPTQTTVTSDFIVRADGWIDRFSGHDWIQHTATQEMYDGVGYGPRAAKILLRNTPIISVDPVNGVQWYDGTIWQPASEGKPNAVAPINAYEFYPERAMIMFYTLRLDGMKRYRVTYVYGYATVPPIVADLSRTLAGLDVITSQQDTFAEYRIGELTVRYPEGAKLGAQHKRLIEKANRLLYSLSLHAPYAGTG